MIEAMVKMQGMRQIEYIVDSTYFLGFDCTGFDCGGRGTVCPFSICSRSGFGFALGSGFLFGAGILDLSLILFSGKRSLRKRVRVKTQLLMPSSKIWSPDLGGSYNWKR